MNRAVWEIKHTHMPNVKPAPVKASLPSPTQVGMTGYTPSRPAFRPILRFGQAHSIESRGDE